MNGFSAIDIRDAIGQMADGIAVDKQVFPVVRAAVTGTCKTSDRGEQIFVVDISGANLHNVDTEELIWPKSPGDKLDDDLPIHSILNADAWIDAMNQWTVKDPVAWTAFVWRIAVPLANRLKLREAWNTIRTSEN